MFSIKPDPIISPGHFRVYVLPQKTCLSAREQNKPANLPPRWPRWPRWWWRGKQWQFSFGDNRQTRRKIVHSVVEKSNDGKNEVLMVLWWLLGHLIFMGDDSWNPSLWHHQRRVVWRCCLMWHFQVPSCRKVFKKLMAPKHQPSKKICKSIRNDK